MRTMLLFTFCLGIWVNLHGQTSGGCLEAAKAPVIQPTSIGIVIYSNDTETVWNALRLANYSLGEGDTVSVFLLGKGVEISGLSSTAFDVTSQLNDYINAGGQILACGTCMRSRQMKESSVCPISTLHDLYDLIRKKAKVMTF